jgi:glycosyltransferase involved in cell wall biosynthesis
MEPTLSFIVPTYNREALIERCLDSVLSARRQDVEIVIIDNSTDGTPAICEEYASRYPNISFHHSPHRMGISGARNAALKLARGRFLFFLDSDDTVFTEVIPDLTSVLKHCPETDIVCMNTKSLNTSGREGRCIIVKEEGFFDAETYIANDPGIANCPHWHYVFRNDFIKKNNVAFPEGSSVEDVEFVLKAFCCAEKIYLLPCFFYRYDVTNDDSNTKRVSDIEDYWLLGLKNFAATGKELYLNTSSKARKNLILTTCARIFMTMSRYYDTDNLITSINNEIIHQKQTPSPSKEAFYSLDYCTPNALAAKYLMHLFETLRERTNNFQKKLYICVCYPGSLTFAKVITHLGGVVSGFLDNNPTPENDNVVRCVEAGYEVFPVSSLKGRHDAFVFITHDIYSVTQAIAGQMESLGINQDDCCTLYSAGRSFFVRQENTIR